MQIRRGSNAAATVFTALLAAVFFFFGYALKASPVAGAPAASPASFGDGNPSGHFLSPPQSFVPPGNATAMLECLKRIAKWPIAIRYVTATPGHQPHLPKPTCSGKNCVTFFWPKMTLITKGPAPTFEQGGPEQLDIYGTLSFD